MSNRLYFNAREWSFNKACEKNVGERCFINGIEGKLVEVYTIGNWEWNWTEIISKQLVLEKNTDYSLCFWLNGGENDRNCETCQLRVVFDGNNDDCLIYKLNRGFIKPLKRYKGWELYDISFSTGNNDLTQLKFVAQCAYMAVQPAKEPEAYAELEEVLDEFEDMRPQRHNLVFEDGWPATGWYSTKELRKKKESEKRNEAGANYGPKFGPKFGAADGVKFGSHRNAGDSFPFGQNSSNMDLTHLSEIPNIPNISELSHLSVDIKDNILKNLKLNIDMDELADTIKNEIDMDDIVDEIKDEIDIEKIKDEIKNSINIASLREEVRNDILKSINK